MCVCATHKYGKHAQKRRAVNDCRSILLPGRFQTFQILLAFVGTGSLGRVFLEKRGLRIYVANSVYHEEIVGFRA